MKHLLTVSLLLLLGAGSLFALTGFGESNTFSIIEETLPVELSSFTATITAQNYVRLSWETQSESNLLGYYLYRNTSEELSTGSQISGLISPTNSSNQHTYTYLDSDIAQSGSYYYWLHSQELDGSGNYHGPITVLVNLEAEQPGIPAIPQQTGLRTIYPNPFNPSTTISYGLDKTDSVNIKIFNSRGQLVRSLDEGLKTAGYYHLIWNGDDASGKSMPTGVYYIRMQAGHRSFHKKAVLMK